MINLESKYLPYDNENKLEEHRQEAYNNLKIRLLQKVLAEEEIRMGESI